VSKRLIRSFKLPRLKNHFNKAESFSLKAFTAAKNLTGSTELVMENEDINKKQVDSKEQTGSDNEETAVTNQNGASGENDIFTGFSFEGTEFSPDSEENNRYISTEEAETSHNSGSSGVEDHQRQILELRSLLEEQRQNYLRVLADFDNFRKNSQKQRSDLLKYQGEQIVFDLLEVLDNFSRAIAVTGGDVENMKIGVEMIYRQFVDIFAKWGIKSDSVEGALFDPNLHSAISTVEMADKPNGTIVSVLKHPYYYKDKLIRPAEVIVSKAPFTNQSEPSSKESEEGVIANDAESNYSSEEEAST
jgi:molecular chaperone GrpE